MNLEQTYTLRQKYLNYIGYKDDSKLNPINEKTPFKKIAEYIDKELSKPIETKLPPDIKNLHAQIYSIVYLNRLSDYYVSKLGPSDIFNIKKIIGRLKNTSALIEKKQLLLSNHLQLFIKSLSEEDKAAEALINHELKYLKAVYSSELSSEAEKANQSYLKIDIQKIKAQAKENYITLKRLFESYKLRCAKEMEKANMSEPKNDSFLEKEESKPTDSGNCSDDDASSYHTAPENPDEQTIDVEQPKKSTAHTEEQKQNTPHKESLLAQIWTLLKKIWQKIKSIFTHSEKNHELDSTSVTFSKSAQSITFIPAVKNKKGYTTLYSHKADSRQNQSPEPKSVAGPKLRC